MTAQLGSSTDRVVWERAEMARSDVEAAQLHSGSLVIGQKKRNRYRAPAADTCYALEYTYHLVGDVQGQAVLDFGCGSGDSSVLLAFRGADVTGVDISPSLIALARERARVNGVADRVRFTVTSAHQLPFPPASFDLVVGIAILHHLDLDAAAREVFRVLRPGGRAIFQEPVRNSAVVRGLRRVIPYRSPEVSPFERPLTDRQIERFGAAFDKGRSRAFSLPHVNLAQVMPIMRKYVHPCLRLDGRLLRRYPALHRYATGRVFELVKPGRSSHGAAS